MLENLGRSHSYSGYSCVLENADKNKSTCRSETISLTASIEQVINCANEPSLRELNVDPESINPRAKKRGSNRWVRAVSICVAGSFIAGSCYLIYNTARNLGRSQDIAPARHNISMNNTLITGSLHSPVEHFSAQLQNDSESYLANNNAAEPYSYYKNLYESKDRKKNPQTTVGPKPRSSSPSLLIHKQNLASKQTTTPSALAAERYPSPSWLSSIGTDASEHKPLINTSTQRPTVISLEDSSPQFLASDSVTTSTNTAISSSAQTTPSSTHLSSRLTTSTAASNSEVLQTSPSSSPIQITTSEYKHENSRADYINTLRQGYYFPLGKDNFHEMEIFMKNGIDDIVMESFYYNSEERCAGIASLINLITIYQDKEQELRHINSVKSALTSKEHQEEILLRKKITTLFTAAEALRDKTNFGVFYTDVRTNHKPYSSEQLLERKNKLIEYLINNDGDVKSC